MSLYSALYAGVSGLNAQSAAMATVADNITNINTVGYKGTDTQFSTLINDGGAASAYSAGGTNAVTRALISKQGVLQAAASSTDLGIDGNGFFVTRANSPTGEEIAFTRAGAFSPDQNGYLRNSGGYYLMGWPMDGAGNYANNGSMSALEPVRVSDLTGTALPTSKITLRANLQSTTPVFSGAYAAGAMASGTATPDFSRAIEVYDAQGGSHTLNLAMVKTAANQWAAEIYAVPATDVAAADGLMASGTIAFNADGSLDVANSSPALFGSLTPAWTNGAGAQAISLGLGSDGKIDGLTQFGSASALIASTVDGGQLGNISSIDVSKSGVVSAIFDDGTTRKVFQLPLATFADPDALERLPGNGFAVSSESGGATLNPPGSLSAGMIASNMLEASNADLGSEFSNMIRFQRAYSASSKIITTVDDMLQEVSNLKR